MEIRKIQPEDAKDFVKFYQKLAEESEYLLFTPEEVADKADREEEFIKNYNEYKQVFIALIDDKIVGYLGIKRSHLEKLRHVAQFTVGVLEDHHRKGIATRLLKAAEEWAKEHDVKRMELTVLEDNDGAIDFFEENDFDKEGEREKAFLIDGDYEDEIFMAKIL